MVYNKQNIVKNQKYIKILLALLICGISCSILISGCENKSNPNSDVSDISGINGASENTASQELGEINGNRNISSLEDEYTYSKISTISIENNMKNITRIVSKDDALFGTGYSFDPDGTFSYSFFTVDVDSSSVNYNPYSTPKGTELLDMNVNTKKEIFFICLNFDSETSTELYTLNMIDTQGNLHISIELNDYMASDIFPDIRGLVIDNDNNIFIQTGGNIIVFNPDGTLLFEIDMEDKLSDRFFTMYTGEVVIPTFSDGGAIMLYTIDMNAKKLKEMKMLSKDYLITSGFGKDAEIFIFAENVLNSHSLANDTDDFVLNWLNVDLDYSRIYSLCALSSNRLAFLFDDTQDITEITILEKAKVQESSKIIITMASLSPDVDLINKFNRSNEKYRIEVVDYSEYIIENNYSEAVNKLNLDILAGNIPDIFDFYLLEYEEYVESDILADLYDYFENDKDISKDSLVNGVLEALSINDKLFAITPGFTIGTVVGLSSNVGSDTNINLDQLIQLQASLPEGTKLFNNMFNGLFVDLYCAANLDNFIDYEQRRAHFDSEEFIRVLEFASQFAPPITSETNAIIPLISDEESMKRGETIFSYRELQSMIDLYMLEVDSVGKDLTVVGVPTNSNIGSMMSPTALYGVYNNTKNPEGAWNFIKYLFSEKYQKDLSIYFFPILESIYNEEINKLMNPDNNRIDDPNLGELQYPAMTQAQADEIFDMIATCSVRQPNITIMNIIHEESSAFFNGVKSAEETVKVINDKVEVFLKERP